MVRLCTICARGGSKGLPGKNVKPLLGRPLIGWSIWQAQQSGLFDAITVSTDSAEVIRASRDSGVGFTISRPSHLAGDTAPKIPAIVHAVTQAEKYLDTIFDTVVDLDATSPLRTPEDIIAAVRILEETGCTNVITGTESNRSPYFNMVEFDNHGILRLVKPGRAIERRQDAPKTYDMNASIYAWDRDRFLQQPKLFYHDTQLYEMPRERSIDIDTHLDFDFVEMIMRRKCLN